MSKYKDRMRDQREQEVIEAARQLLAEQGFANFNMEEVAERVGISKPTLYQHFDSREALIVRVIVGYFRDLDESIAQADGLPALEQIKHRMRVTMKSRYKAAAIFPHFNPEFIQLMRSNEQLAPMREQAMQQLHNLIDQGKAEGQIRSDVPTSILAPSIFCLQATLSHAFQELPDEDSIDKNIEHVINILVQGIQA